MLKQLENIKHTIMKEIKKIINIQRRKQTLNQRLKGKEKGNF
jgi:hypothetical protein